MHLRQGANLYTNSIIVLDARTGKLRWHLQLVPNDSHDWDLTHATPMFNAVVNGATRRLVVTTGKDGMLRALDRDTHRVGLRDGGDNAGERRHAGDHDADCGRAPASSAAAEWNGPAYNPGTNMLCVPAVDWCATLTRRTSRCGSFPAKAAWAAAPTSIRRTKHKAG